jgi:hypothetical protein
MNKGIDVVVHKGHQVLLTTHSEELLRALPDESRVYLYRTIAGISAINGLSSGEAQCLMTNGNDKALCVLVEDNVARAVLREILRTVDPRFLTCVHIGVGGDKDALARTIRGLQDTGLKVAAVRDGDKEGSPRENIFKLPRTKPPEIELFEDVSVGQYVQRRFAVTMNDFRAGMGDIHGERSRGYGGWSCLCGSRCHLSA